MYEELSETKIKRKEKCNAGNIFCTVNGFHMLCIFSSKQISKAYFGVLYSYDGCGCHRKSGLSANSWSQDGGGGSAGKSGVLSGISFLLLFTIQAIADLCKTRIPAAVRGVCICICFIIFLGASSAGRVDWYYRSVEMVIRDGYTFLKREYGPLHLLSPIYIVITLVCGLIIIVNALRKKKHVSYFVSVCSLCLLFLFSATFV